MEHQTINSPSENTLPIGVLPYKLSANKSLNTIYNPKVNYFGNSKGQFIFYPVGDIWKVKQENKLIEKLNEPNLEKSVKETTQSTPTDSNLQNKILHNTVKEEVSEDISKAIVGGKAPPLSLPDIISSDPPPIIKEIKDKQAEEKIVRKSQKVYS